MKRYQILKFNWEYDVSRVLTKRKQRILEHGYAPSAKRRESAIQDKLALVALHHLEIGSVDDLPKQAEAGVDLVVDYFCGDWWTEAGFARLSDEVKMKYDLVTPEKLEAEQRGERLLVDRSEPSDRLRWFTPLRAGLLLGGLTGRWNDVARICSWFDTSIPPEYCAGETEDEMFQLFICIAGELNPQPVPGIDELLAKVGKSRVKRPRLLCAAWEAVLAKDQAAFEKAFVESVKHFVAKPSDSRILYNIVALPQSIIGLIAEHRGLQLPAMPEKCQAAVVTRETVGFA